MQTLKKIATYKPHPAGKPNPYSSPSHASNPRHTSTPTLPPRTAATAFPTTNPMLAEARLAAGRDPRTGKRMPYSENREQDGKREREKEKGWKSRLLGKGKGKERAFSAPPGVRRREGEGGGGVGEIENPLRTGAGGTRYDGFVHEMGQRRELGSRDPLAGYYAPPPGIAIEYYAPGPGEPGWRG